MKIFLETEHESYAKKEGKYEPVMNLVHCFQKKMKID
jgi:hypothetical protein